MNLLSPKEIKSILSQNNAKPSKRLGQNFLIDKKILEKIISSANLNKNDIVLEVGPGIGTLTQELAKSAGKVIAVEKDRKMIEILKKTLSEFNNIEIINADILKIKNSDLFKNYKIKNYKIVSNIPYYLTSPLIRKFLESDNQPSEIILMVQKEVAQRICLPAGRQAQIQPKMNLLAVSVQFYAEAKIISYVSKNCFWPSPKVDSAIIKIIPHKEGRPPRSTQLFFKIVKAGFSHPRKQLAGNLAKSLKLKKQDTENWLLESGIKPSQRAETLSLQDWKNLANSVIL